MKTDLQIARLIDALLHNYITAHPKPQFHHINPPTIEFTTITTILQTLTWILDEDFPTLPNDHQGPPQTN